MARKDDERLDEQVEQLLVTEFGFTDYQIGLIRLACDVVARQKLTACAERQLARMLR